MSIGLQEKNSASEPSIANSVPNCQAEGLITARSDGAGNRWSYLVLSLALMPTRMPPLKKAKKVNTGALKS